MASEESLHERRLLNIIQGFPAEDDEHSDLRRAMSRSVAMFLSGDDEAEDEEPPLAENMAEALCSTSPVAKPKVCDSFVMGQIVTSVLRRAYEPQAEDLQLAICMDNDHLRSYGQLPITLEQLRMELLATQRNSASTASTATALLTEKMLRQRMIWVVAMHPRYTLLWNFEQNALFTVVFARELPMVTPPKDLVDDFEEFLWKSLARKRAKRRAMSRKTSIEDEN
eukprot:symbB.v1.2.000095.t1/scaffold13.1/size649204/6